MSSSSFSPGRGAGSVITVLYYIPDEDTNNGRQSQNGDDGEGEEMIPNCFEMTMPPSGKSGRVG